MNISDFFFDTDPFLSDSDIKIISTLPIFIKAKEKKLSDTSLFMQLNSLYKKGKISLFEYDEMSVFYNKSSYESQPVTIRFFLYFPKINKTTSEQTFISDSEKTKIKENIRFIKKWIFYNTKISEKNIIFKNFIKLFTKRTQFVFSFPYFMMNDFNECIKSTGIEYEIISILKKQISCPYCGFKKITNKNNSEHKCIQCGLKFITSI